MVEYVYIELVLLRASLSSCSASAKGWWMSNDRDAVFFSRSIFKSILFFPPQIM